MNEHTINHSGNALQQIERIEAYLKSNYPNAKGQTTAERAISALEEMDIALGSQEIPAIRAALKEVRLEGTPASHWRARGEPDPHGALYDCDRSDLTLGELTDDELANEAFLRYNEVPNMADLLNGTAKMPIVYMTAAKDRIRWLSRQLFKTSQQIVLMNKCQAKADAVTDPEHALALEFAGRLRTISRAMEDFQGTERSREKLIGAFTEWICECTHAAEFMESGGLAAERSSSQSIPQTPQQPAKVFVPCFIRMDDCSSQPVEALRCQTCGRWTDERCEAGGFMRTPLREEAQAERERMAPTTNPVEPGHFSWRTFGAALLYGMTLVPLWKFVFQNTKNRKKNQGPQ